MRLNLNYTLYEGDDDSVLETPNVMLLYCTFTIAVVFVAQVVSSEYMTPQDDNPDIYLTTPEMIRRHGYQAETHTIQTSDGYLLGVHRIPQGRTSVKAGPRPVIFLQHGLISSSTDWVLTGPEKSLAFMLSDRGFDVWLGNARGNGYSKAHARLRNNNPEFWKFSWDQMAEYDLPATIDHILNVTGVKSITYIGHSMGTTMFFALMSSKPEYQQKVNLMIALAPAVFFTHMTSPIRKLVPWVDNIQMLSKFLGSYGELLPQDKLLRYLAEEMCSNSYVAVEVCSNFMFVLSGYDRDQLNETLIPVILSHAPAETSIMTAIQFVQQIKSGHFSKFDYEANNMVIYNSTTPPLYDLKKITMPIALFTAENDLFVNKTDVARLKSILTSVVEHYHVPFPLFNHVDFLFAKEAPTLVYDEVFKLVEKHLGDQVMTNTVQAPFDDDNDGFIMNSQYYAPYSTDRK